MLSECVERRHQAILLHRQGIGVESRDGEEAEPSLAQKSGEGGEDANRGLIVSVVPGDELVDLLQANWDGLHASM